ncbi:SDR family oxidoreductase [Flavihumibacter cheonanensis]|uniref:SDR family oxidoreductase n=1 Tax=Flavihumibacter cheonanensis TaxID=1442385 RepID=UPI001EF7FB76|nr:SDR family oxidoreductase [Flavihumibacter cheonanensis]MCG7752475.1 SDR family oxidoreductase [Flavihumibacter cheonanensis]
MQLSLENKTALVCGSTQGIGLAAARELALLGANCILLARNEVALQEAVYSLDTSKGQQHSYAVADFSSPDEVKKSIEEILMKHTINILVNNTGGPKPGPIIDADTNQFLHAFQQHVVVNQLLTQAVVPGMKKLGYGRIINIVSTSVKIPLNNLGVSNTIRGAVASWSKTMANELGQFGITVNNVLPGFTSTARLKSLAQSLAADKGITVEEQERSMAAEVPLKRFGKAEETAALVAFLACPAAAYITGTSIPVDGGRTGSL